MTATRSNDPDDLLPDIDKISIEDWYAIVWTLPSDAKWYRLPTIDWNTADDSDVRGLDALAHELRGYGTFLIEERQGGALLARRLYDPAG